MRYLGTFLHPMVVIIYDNNVIFVHCYSSRVANGIVHVKCLCFQMIKSFVPLV